MKANKKNLLIGAAVAGLIGFGGNAMADDHGKTKGKAKAPGQTKKAEMKTKKGEKMKCMGVNSCHNAKHGNECKGAGYEMMSKKDCDAAKGKKKG